MTYHQLRTFLTVARTGNLTTAARELDASQPTVSLQLRALQKSLGTALIERVGSGFRLTPAGEKLRRYAEEALTGLRTLQQDLAALKGRLAGPLAVGATFVMSRYVLPSAMFKFREHYPDVNLQLHVDFPESLFSGLQGNALDVASYIGIRTPAGLTVETIFEDEWVTVASPKHPLAGRRRVSPQELSAHPFVAPLSVRLREVLEAKLGAAGVAPQVAAEALHLDAVKNLVERNVGYSMLIRSSVTDDLASGRLVALRLDGPPVLGELVMAFRSRPVISPLVQEFIRFVRAELTRAPDVAKPRPRGRPLPADRRAPASRPRRPGTRR
jgi:DNA-binding transcriptional LysR family regulator